MKYLHVMPADGWFAAYARKTAPYYSIVRLAGWARIIADGQETFVGLRPRGTEVVPATQVTDQEIFFGYICKDDHSREAIEAYKTNLIEYGVSLQEEHEA